MKLNDVRTKFKKDNDMVKAVRNIMILLTYENTRNSYNEYFGESLGYQLSHSRYGNMFLASDIVVATMKVLGLKSSSTGRILECFGKLNYMYGGNYINTQVRGWKYKGQYREFVSAK